MDIEATPRAEQALSLMASRWALPVLERVSAGVIRFNALQRSVDGISHRVLAVTLRRLAEAGVVERRDFQSNPPHGEYHLTDAGRSLITTAYGFCAWSKQFPG